MSHRPVQARLLAVDAGVVFVVARSRHGALHSSVFRLKTLSGFLQP
jgi:hypothetical protein